MKRTIVTLAACALLGLGIAGCAPATPTPVAPLSSESAAGGGMVSGLVTYGGAPLADARVELRAADWRVNPNATVAEAVADANGEFLIENSPAGDWVVIGLFPDGEEDAGGFPTVVVDAGQSVTDVTVPMEHGMRLIEPVAALEVKGAPTLRWEAVADATQYEVWVIDAGTTALVLNQTVAETTLTVEEPLESGHTYEWVVNARNADGVDVATATNQFIAAP